MVEHAPAKASGPTGLRERKKRETRQHISNTATALFLEHGFDQVRVADVAAACDVSEKTVYNYFANKESLVFDREPAMAALIRETLGPDGAGRSPAEAIVEVIGKEIELLFAEREGNDSDFQRVSRFLDMIEESPSLRTAQRDLMDHLAQVAASAMAHRAGLDPLDPEPQAAASALIGIWSVSMRALRREASNADGPSGARAAVLADTRRAARLIGAGLASFATTARDQ
jgi:AcrR family transcriptional regulator